MQLINQKKKKTKKPLPNLFDEAEKAQEKVKTRKIQIGWIHFNEQQERYISVRLQKGGGTREVHVPLNANVQKIVDIASEIFFQNGMSTFGALEDMEVSLANFRSETLPLHTPEGNEFTLQYYVTSNKATKVRMYLKTQIKSTVHRHTPMVDITDDDSDLLNPVFPGNEGEDAVSQILGTSAEREQLKSEQEQELMASMARDREREEETRRVLNKELEKANRQLRLQKACWARIEMAPEESQSNVNVSVRHPSLGIISRAFHQCSSMTPVYDWMGSLSLMPEHFRPCLFDGKCLLPSEPVQVAQRTMLYMSECENVPNLLEEDAEINFHGFGDTCD